MTAFLNLIASIAILCAALRGLCLFHCRLGLAGRLAVAAFGFCAFASIARGDLYRAPGFDELRQISAGAAAAAFLWTCRRMQAPPVDCRRSVNRSAL